VAAPADISVATRTRRSSRVSSLYVTAGAGMTITQTLRRKWLAFSYYAGGYPRPGAVLRWGMWAVRCLLRQPAVVTIERLGLRLYLEPQWSGCWKPIYVFRDRFFELADPELQFMQQTLRPGDVFLDVGAFHGWYALVASRIVGERGYVLAFEPNPDTFAILTRNIVLNNCRNVQAFNVALSSADGTVSLFKGPNDGSMSSLALVPDSTGQVQVTARRLDSLLEELHIRRVDFIKADIQGGEANLFHGAIGLLRGSLPVIVFELAPQAARDMGVPETEAWNLLAGLGYSFVRLSASALEPVREFPVVAGGAFLNINIIAIPDRRELAGAAR